MSVLIALIFAGLVAQDPPGTAEVTPGARSTEQAQIDVCLYTPPQNRDSGCTPLLEAEVALVPAEALAASDSMAWAGQACPASQYADATARSACRGEQRGLYRRAERARQALIMGTAGGVYAETAGVGPPAPTGVGDSDGQGFSETRRPLGDNCEQRSSARHDQVTGDQSSSHSFNCSFGSDDPALRESVQQALGSVLDD